MFNWINKPNLYTLGWCIYFYQGILFPDGFIAIKLILIVLLVISLYYVFVANTQYKIPAYLIGLNTLLSLFTIYGLYLVIIPFEYSPIPGFDFLKTIYISLLPVYTFYIFSKEGKINAKNIQVWAIFFIVLTIVYYFVSEQAMLLKALRAKLNKEEFTNNIGYLFTALIPLSLFFKKYIICQYVILGTCIIFMIMAMKRGAIFIGGICIMLVIWNTLKTSNIKTKIIITIMTFFLIVLGFKYVEYKMETSDYFIQRIEQTSDGNASGRDRLFSVYLNHFLDETSPSHFLFGSGANYTSQMIGAAHNDWLEIATNHGLLGIFIFIFYWSMFAKTAWCGKIARNERLILQVIFIDFFLRTLFSMSYTEMIVVTQVTLGYCLSQEVQNG